jgi:dsDNA-specific endonuclease/ATPase MutS2
MRKKTNQDESQQNDTSTVDYGRATTMEGRENELIALAYNAAEERIRNGTASAAEIVHFLKLGSSQGRYEQEATKADIELKKAKVDAIHQAETLDGLYKDAIDAIKRYTNRSE